MLDVMKNPPVVNGEVVWKASRTELPDSDITVLVYQPDDDCEPVWLGFWADDKDQWLDIEGMPLGMVTWWADLPAAPVEPTPSPTAARGPNLDDLRRLREAAMSSGAGTARWIKCATALIDAFPAIYAMAKAMNDQHASRQGG